MTNRVPSNICVEIGTPAQTNRVLQYKPSELRVIETRTVVIEPCSVVLPTGVLQRVVAAVAGSRDGSVGLVAIEGAAEVRDQDARDSVEPGEPLK